MMRVDKGLRIGAGVGLLLLLAAQGKFCPWLTAPPPEPQADGERPGAGGAPAAPDAAAAPGAPAEGRKPAKPRLAHLLPDTAAPRWPASWSQVVIRQAAGARDGVISQGQRDPGAPVAAALPAAAGGDWHRLQRPAGPENVILAATARRSPPETHFQTVIQRTGPPAA